MRVLKNSENSHTSSAITIGIVASLLAACGAAVALWCASRGYLLFYGDAEAHLNIARRVLDSRTPGREQLGTVWLPLPHILLMPFTMKDTWWYSGLAAVIPSVVCFTLAGTFLFSACRRIFGSIAAAGTALLVFALNPNMLYLQATPMTEPVFAAALTALFWATVMYKERPAWGFLWIAAIASNAAALTRYEGWFLIPFAAAYLLLSGPNKWHALCYSALAAIGPLAWLAHNAYYYSNPLEFYNGDYSAMAIYRRQLAEGVARYPGDHNLREAIHYYAAAVKFVAGWGTVGFGVAGAIIAVARKHCWPILLLTLAPVFYVLSIHSSGTPLYVPGLWPDAWYNTRYALAALPLLAFGAASAVDALRIHPLVSGRTWAAATLVSGIALTGALTSLPITWQESRVNSLARREWTRQAAKFMSTHYRTGSGVIYSFGDLTGILREAHIPLREGLHEGNRPNWDAAVQRPDLFLREEWAIAVSGDKLATAILRAGRTGPHYNLEKQIIVEGAPVIEIYRRVPIQIQ